MFDTVLVANRGEIALRIMRTARRLGLSTVAVHSDADAGAWHAQMADRAVRIGPAPVSESYLKADAIIDAALRTGAGAIHPGYGFLSENPDFVDAVTAAGLVFVGPSADAIRSMGLKDAAKRLMEQAGVPVVPGYHGAEQGDEKLAAEAGHIGYPVLIKARAGGGGKGMRRVDKPADFLSALEGARREAAAAFGDAACLVEKYVTHPRHIEIQVFGDNYGNAVHLYERDCSLQRRHQKVLEEAPAPGMTDAMREAMGNAAIQAARTIAYSGAGTVEFIVDASQGLRPDRFWFMEMNTRLQVEHPVTEAITGLDLVEWQLRVAAGETLPLRQDEIAIAGHAVEARIYAENPARGFLPATGRLTLLAMPDHVRVDSGVRQGDAVTPHYDPMIAKVIAHGPSRAAALGSLRRALAEARIAGLATNLAFLGRLAAQPDFAAGRVDTGLIERHLDLLAPDRPVGALPFALAALALQGLLERPAGNDPWHSLTGFRVFGGASMPIRIDIDGRLETVLTGSRPGGWPGGWQVTVGQDTLDIAIDLSTAEPRVTIDGMTRPVGWHRDGRTVTIFHNGETIVAHQPEPGRRAEAAEAGDSVFSPMPGTVRMVAAKAGDTVARGAALIVVEAMKMEHTLTAPRDGRIAEILVSVGDRADDGMLLLRLAEDGA